MKRYVHTHHHSEFSLLDGSGTMTQICGRVADIGQIAIAITDHGNIHGWVPLSVAAKKAKIKPLFGIEAYIVENMLEKKQGNSDMGTDGIPHITLFALNAKGFRNINLMVEKANKLGFYRYPRIDFQCLIEHSEGVQVLSGCPTGWPTRLISTGYYENALALMQYLSDRIEHYGVEIVPQAGYGPAEVAIRKLVDAADAIKRPIYINGDGHFVGPQDHVLQDTMLHISLNIPFNQEKPFSLAAYNYINTADEMEIRILNTLAAQDGYTKTMSKTITGDYYYSRLINSIENTHILAEQIDVDIPKLKGFQFFPTVDETERELHKLIEAGYEQKKGQIPPDKIQEYAARFAYEYNILKGRGFLDYILLVAYIVKKQKDKGRLVVCRGSAGGSLLLWILGVAIADPIKWKLSFERFFDKDRPDAPDVDLDLERRWRDQAVEEIIEEFGEEFVARIAAFGTYKPNAVLSDIMRLNLVPREQADKVTARINFLQQENEEEESSTADEQLEILRESVRQAVSEDEQISKLNRANVIHKILGQKSRLSMHAAGIVIAGEPLHNATAIISRPATTSKPATPPVICTDKIGIDHLGLMKLDLLSVTALDVVAQVLKLCKLDASYLDTINVEDPILYERISQYHQIAGIFQVDGSVMKINQQTPIDSFSACYNASALCRPGAMNFVGDYARLKDNPSLKQVWRDTTHPKIVDCLEETHGVILFQERLMDIARLVGFTEIEVQKLRKIVSKSGTVQLREYRDKFIVGAETNLGISHDEAKRIWDEQLEPHGKYSFNLSHCLTYNFIGMWMMHLKVYYPEQFYIGMIQVLLSEDAPDGLLIHRLVREALSFGIFEGAIPLYAKFGGTVTSITIEGKKYLIGGWGAIRGVRSMGEKYAAAFNGTGKVTPAAAKILTDIANAVKTNDNAVLLRTSLWYPAQGPKDNPSYQKIIGKMRANGVQYLEPEKDEDPTKVFCYCPDTLPQDEPRRKAYLAGWVSYERKRADTLAHKDQARFLYVDDGSTGVVVTSSDKYPAYHAIRGMSKDQSAKPGDFLIMQGFWSGLQFYAHKIEDHLKSGEL